MGQVLTFPALKKANKSVKKSAARSASNKIDNVLLFNGVFVEYHDKPVVHKRTRSLKWVSDTQTTPRRGQH